MKNNKFIEENFIYNLLHCIIVIKYPRNTRTQRYYFQQFNKLFR